MPLTNTLAACAKQAIVRTHRQRAVIVLPLLLLKTFSIFYLPHCFSALSTLAAISFAEVTCATDGFVCSPSAGYINALLYNSRTCPNGICKIEDCCASTRVVSSSADADALLSGYANNRAVRPSLRAAAHDRFLSLYIHLFGHPVRIEFAGNVSAM